jgi:hypothetical protein
MITVSCCHDIIMIMLPCYCFLSMITCINCIWKTSYEAVIFRVSSLKTYSLIFICKLTIPQNKMVRKKCKNVYFQTVFFFLGTFLVRYFFPYSIQYRSFGNESLQYITRYSDILIIFSVSEKYRISKYLYLYRKCLALVSSSRLFFILWDSVMKNNV